MPNTPPVRPAMMLTLLLLLMTVGCADSGDERLAEMARQTSREQARQNEWMAEENRQIAAASRHLVEQDAQSNAG